LLSFSIRSRAGNRKSQIENDGATGKTRDTGYIKEKELIMKSFITLLVFLSVVGMAGAGCCGAAKPMADEAAAVGAGKAQTTCPVLDEPIQNKNVYVDHNGLRVYLCCAGCKATFSKDPEKYIKKLEAEGVQIEKAPAQE
jgi:hypothetical protein